MTPRLALTLTGCDYTPSAAETSIVTEMTTHMRTHGVGRYMIDLPPSWKWTGAMVTLYYGIDADHKTVNVQVLDTGVTPERFVAAVNERAKRIKIQTHAYKKVSMLE